MRLKTWLKKLRHLERIQMDDLAGIDKLTDEQRKKMSFFSGELANYLGEIEAFVPPRATRNPLK